MFVIPNSIYLALNTKTFLMTKKVIKNYSYTLNYLLNFPHLKIKI